MPLSVSSAAASWDGALSGPRIPAATAPTGVWRRSWLALLAVLGVALVWRLPSLFDPPMVQDEGTYFAVAQAMAHHYRLYADIWENKPPALYLLYGVVYHFVGASLLTIRVITSAAALALVTLVFRIARLYVHTYAALAAAMLAGLLLGIPFFEGTTGNAEIFLAVCAALGVYLAVGRGRSRLAGLCLGFAILFKAVACLDAAALAIWLARERPRLAWRYLAVVATVLGAVAFVAWIEGVLPAMLHDALLYDVGYVGYANGGSIPWVLYLKVAGMVALTVALRRAPFPYLWLVYALVGAMFSGRLNGHYAIQAVAPLAISCALLLNQRAALARRLTIAMPTAIGVGVVISSLLGWSLVHTGHNSFAARRMQWYLNFARFATGQESYAAYRGQIDENVNGNLRIAQTIDSLPPGKIIVWGNAPWLYVLSDRLPATPYTTSLWHPEVPGESSILRHTVENGRAAALVMMDATSPPVGAAKSSLEHLYRPVSTVGTTVIYALVR